MIIALFSAVSAFANPQEENQKRLVDLEMARAAASAHGLGPKHPKVVQLDTDFKVLSQIPAIKDENYTKMLEVRKMVLKVELDKATAEGMGLKHPLVVGIQAQIKACETLVKR